VKKNRIILLFLLLLPAIPAWGQPVRVIATGDMHGYLESQKAGEQQLGGAAEMLAYWEKREKYRPERFLLLSCGDIATGPAISTLFRGDSVIAVMSRMGYDATVIGNHEFDFGLDTLQEWEKTAHFPFLAANLRYADGRPFDLSQPYYLNDEQGVRIGIIGLGYSESSKVSGQPALGVLRRVVPELRAQGAQMVIVLSHLPFDELVALAGKIGDLQVPLLLGGHDHNLAQKKVNGTWVVNSGEKWESYSRINLDYDPATGKSRVLTAKQVWLQQDKLPGEKTVKEEIAGWEKQMGEEINLPLGYSRKGLPRFDPVYNFVCDTMLAFDSQAQIALTNAGALRCDLPPGYINRKVIIELMPFDDQLFRINLTGEQLLAYLPETEAAIGGAGLRHEKSGWHLAGSDEPIAAETVYRVIVNDYMYNASEALQKADPKPVVVAEDWREPIYTWLKAHPSSREKPLETLVDTKSRFQD
jgi:5'-nucleotidase / UDP-sugar diphosphatase